MQNTTHAAAALSAAGQFAGPISGHNAALSIFVGTSTTGSGTLTLQCRPTPKAAYVAPGIAEETSAIAATPEPWADVTVTLAPGLNVIPATPGDFDFQVGYKTGAAVTGIQTVYLQAEAYAAA